MTLTERLTEAQEKQMSTEQKRLSSLSDKDLAEEMLNNAPTPPHELTMAELEQMRRLKERKTNG